MRYANENQHVVRWCGACCSFEKVCISFGCGVCLRSVTHSVTETEKQNLGAMATDQEVINIQSWIENNKSSFKPPVMNKLMHRDGILKVMFVGGPNTRSDFHIEEGEELFIQIKGSMLLKLQIEPGHIRDLEIKEGEVFLLPARMPHSPQRFPNTVGFVMERERSQREHDCVRYYKEGDYQTVLWEKWIHMNDLVKDLPPVIMEFQQSEQCKSGKPVDGFVEDPLFELNSKFKFTEPFKLKTWLSEHKKVIDSEGHEHMFRGNMQTKVVVYGKNSDPCKYVDQTAETFMWLLKGSACVIVDNSTEQELTQTDDCLLIKPHGGYKLCMDDDSYVMCINMDGTHKMY